jgi:hypothetical protein
MLENTNGAINKDNPEKLATYGTQDTGILENTEEVIKKKDNPETNLGTQDTGQINVREYQRGNKKVQPRETGNIGYTRHRTNQC